MDGWKYVNTIFQPSFTEKLDKDILLAWADLAEGCAHIAERGILHRDLTLDNILISLEGGKPVFKVSDFGVSGTAKDFADVPRGKMRNYPPEAMGGQDYTYTPASDLFMLGLVFWETLHGKLVWSQFNTHEANKRVLAREKPEFETAVAEKCPPQLVSLIID